jgi:hypothetical protein
MISKTMASSRWPWVSFRLLHTFLARHGSVDVDDVLLAIAIGVF